MSFSTIKKRKCKCAIDCKLWPTTGYDGYNRNHAPQKIKEKQDAKTARQRSEANKRKLAKVKKLMTPENNEAVKKQIWFSERRSEMTGWCQCGCGNPSSKNDDKYFRFSVCHILPQRNFESVRWHRLNWIEMAFWGGCHTNMDDRGSDKWPTLACWAEIVRRFKILYPLTYSFERQFIPAALQPIVNEILDNVKLTT